MDNKKLVIILFGSPDIRMLIGAERGYRQRADLRCKRVCTRMHVKLVIFTTPRKIIYQVIHIGYIFVLCW